MNDKNLIPNERRSPSELRENAKKGGEASGEARRKRKALKEIMEIALEGTVKVGDEEIGRDEAIVLALLKKAQKGDVKAFLAVRDTLGEKPKEKIDVSVSDTAREAYERAASAIRASALKGKK